MYRPSQLKARVEELVPRHEREAFTVPKHLFKQAVLLVDMNSIAHDIVQRRQRMSTQFSWGRAKMPDFSNQLASFFNGLSSTRVSGHFSRIILVLGRMDFALNGVGTDHGPSPAPSSSTWCWPPSLEDQLYWLDVYRQCKQFCRSGEGRAAYSVHESSGFAGLLQLTMIQRASRPLGSGPFRAVAACTSDVRAFFSPGVEHDGTNFITNLYEFCMGEQTNTFDVTYPSQLSKKVGLGSSHLLPSLFGVLCVVEMEHNHHEEADPTTSIFSDDGIHRIVEQVNRKSGHISMELMRTVLQGSLPHHPGICRKVLVQSMVWAQAAIREVDEVPHAAPTSLTDVLASIYFCTRGRWFGLPSSLSRTHRYFAPMAHMIQATLTAQARVVVHRDDVGHAEHLGIFLSLIQLFGRAKQRMPTAKGASFGYLSVESVETLMSGEVPQWMASTYSNPMLLVVSLALLQRGGLVQHEECVWLLFAAILLPHMDTASAPDLSLLEHHLPRVSHEGLEAGRTALSYVAVCYAMIRCTAQHRLLNDALLDMCALKRSMERLGWLWATPKGVEAAVDHVDPEATCACACCVGSRIFASWDHPGAHSFWSKCCSVLRRETVVASAPASFS